MDVAILLAAGRGRRLGQPKALMDLGGRTALQRCLQALSAGGVDEVRVVYDGRSDPPPAPGARLVPNPDPERGQTSSVRAGLACAPPLDPDGNDRLLLHTVDHPLVSGDDVGRLIAAHAGRAPGIEIVAPSVDGRRGHPTVFSARMAPEFLALSDAEPAHRVIRRDAERVAHLVMDNPWLVQDIDTPADLARARAALRGT